MSQESVARQPVRLRGSRRRSLDQRLAVRIPALVRLTGSLLMRFPPRSRLRRALLARRIRQGFEAFNRRDWQAALIGLHPEIEVHTDKDPAGVPFGADLEDVYHGHQGLVALWEQWLQAWDEYRFEVEELIDTGEKVVVLLRQRARGRGSGVELDQALAQVYTADANGMPVLIEVFWDPARALKAAGLPA